MFRYPILLFLFCCTLITEAQTPLSLSDALAMALKNNFDIRLEQKQVEQSTVKNTWSEAGLYPDININLSSANSYLYNKPTSPYAIKGYNISDNAAGRISSLWVLFNGFQVHITKDILDKTQMQTEMQAALVVENTVEQVILAYHRISLEKEQLEYLEKVVHLSADRVKLMRQKLQIGSGNNFQVSHEETALYADSTNYILQQQAVRNAQRELNLLLGETNPDTSFVPTNQMDVAPHAYDLNILLEKMRQNNSTLRQQSMLIDLSKRNIDLKKAGLLPQLTADLGYSGTYQWFNADFPNSDRTAYINETRKGHNYGPYVNFSLNIPIFNSKQIRTQIKTARIQFETEKLVAEQTELNLQNELVKAYDRYQILLQAYGLSLKSLQSAETSLQLSQEQLNAGTINAFDYRAVQNNYLSAATRAIQARFEVVQLHTYLVKLTGGLLETSAATF